MYDTFLHTDKVEKSHYEFINEDLWKWLKKHYGCDFEVKRQYTKANSKYMYSTMTSVEARFKIVPIMFVKGEDILSGKVKGPEVTYCQMSKNHTYSNFKKRLTDLLEANGMPDVKQEQIRMWLSDKKADLIKSFDEIAQKGTSMQQDSGASVDN